MCSLRTTTLRYEYYADSFDLIFDAILQEINNAAFIICEIFSKYNSMNGSVGILSKLLDQSSIDKFFEYLRSDVNLHYKMSVLIFENRAQLQ